MTPQVGKVYREPWSGMVVECIPKIVDHTPPGVAFSGKVLDPGKLIKFNPVIVVGKEVSSLNPLVFELFANSREDYDHAVAAGKRSEAGGAS